MKTGSDSFDDPVAPSAQAQQALERATGSSPEPDVVALVRTTAPLRSAAGAATLHRIATATAGDRAVARVVSALDAGATNTLVAADRRTTYLAIYLRPLSGDAAKAAAQRLQRRLAALGDVRVGGPVLAAAQVNDQVSADLRRAELLAFPLLFALALIVFRGVIAATLPLLVGGLAILGTFLALRMVSEFVGLSIFALNLVTGLGLGLAIDYSLFVVSRYREELARRGPGSAALRATMQTAGRTVAFSSLTVALALASLLVFPQRFLYSMGIGGVLVTLIAALAAIVPLPALLALLGDRVNALAPRRLQRTARAADRRASTGGWYRLAHAVMRRPVSVAVACAGCASVASTPACCLPPRAHARSPTPSRASFPPTRPPRSSSPSAPHARLLASSLPTLARCARCPPSATSRPRARSARGYGESTSPAAPGRSQPAPSSSSSAFARFPRPSPPRSPARPPASTTARSALARACRSPSASCASPPWRCCSR